MEFRELSPEEIPADAGVVPGSLVMGAVEKGEVVAVLGAFTAVMLDPLWIAPQHRKHPPGFLWPFWEKVKERLRQSDIRVVVGHADLSQPKMAKILRRLGKVVPLKQQFLISVGE